ncbi:branched-chain amino acid ABC transporter permease [Pseudooceanicola nanhaiensis]|jgi:branched-chain amino acid transport system permease protein|uniref:Branched-chain amino acid ABC transporter permease n=1 Tax=Pseudooceanicola nanhaiensis TaxID=375761 RepID=A0A917T715_9RHOB|nr:branched-chain amino acid ABC transporter permease [Pseudooceanicola nanhaiensis]GGM12299.1 branched-chain amino acid ABC transporter permease [Pseudooceanicola nanhaiensis]
MFDGITPQLLFGQLLIGVINGSFYAMLAMGLAIIFGLMHVVNFAHGAQYMLGAFVAWLLLTHLGIPYWGALFIAPVVVAIFGIVMERLLLKPIANLDHLYSLLVTYAATLVIEGLIRQQYGSTGLPYNSPLPGGVNLGFMFMPWYRLWVVVFSVVTCLGTWLLIEHTKLGSYLRAANESPEIVESFGINVPRMMTLTYGFGVGLAGLSGVLAAPVYQVSPSMGSGLMITIFAVVVIGGMGSIIGAILTGYLLGIVEGLTKVFYPEGAGLVIFFIMLLALIFRPSGLFSGTEKS